MSELETNELAQQVEQFELGNLEKILLRTQNTGAIEELNKEIADLDEIIAQTKNHTMGQMRTLDGEEDSKPRRMHTADTKRKVSPMYISSQLGNLISLKTLKISVLKQKNDLSTSSLDRAYKIISQINKERAAAGQKGELPFAQILSILMDAGVKVPLNPNEHEVKAVLDVEYTEDDVDAALDGVIAEQGIASIRLDSQGNPISDEEWAALQSKGTTPQDDDETSSDHLAVAIYYDESEGEDNAKLYLITEDNTVIREVQMDALDIVELDDETLFDNVFKLPVVSDD